MAEDATITAAMHDSRVSLAGKFARTRRYATQEHSPNYRVPLRRPMPRSRSTFGKRQKEQARQERQREKALRRSERKQTKPENSVDEMHELQKHAEEQAALFRVGDEES